MNESVHEKAHDSSLFIETNAVLFEACTCLQLLTKFMFFGVFLILYTCMEHETTIKVYNIVLRNKMKIKLTTKIFIRAGQGTACKLYIKQYL